MSKEQKVWFIYLTDHHEGPFTVEEISAKHGEGLVNAKTLGWKDGMAEWVPIETIPELAIILQQTPSTEKAPAGGGGELSLAQMLASSQQNDAPILALDDAAPDPIASPDPISALAQKTEIKASAHPPEDSPVWNLRLGNSVSGSYSMNQLLDMAEAGELHDGFELWAPGMTDFQAAENFPDLLKAKSKVSQKKNAPAQNVKIKGLPKSVAIAKKAIADDDEDDVTDPNIEMPAKKATFLLKLKDFFSRKKTAAPKAAKNLSPALKKIIFSTTGVLLLVGAGAYYYLFLMSPIPALEDVKLDDIEQMKLIAKASPEAGAKFYVASSVSDEITPTYYVATNLPEGSILNMELVGVSGTLVNAINFSKKISTTVMKTQLATFGPISNEGKPIPMGDYKMLLSTDNGVKSEKTVFIGGKKTGPVYDRRMKQYKEKLQTAYDQEIQEIREFVQTLKSAKDDMDIKLADMKSAAGKATAANAWRMFGTNFTAIVGQLDQKVKDKIADTAVEKYYPNAYLTVQALIGQLFQFYQLENTQYETGQQQNSQALNTLIQASIQNLEQFLGQAVMRAPLDVLVANATASAAGVAAVMPSTVVPVPATTVTPAPTTPIQATP